MIKKSFYSAVIASGYIALLVSFINWGSKAIGPAENILMPVGMLSLLVLSVAIMGFLFFYQPVILLIEGKKAEAVRHFFITVALFAAISAVVGGISFLLTIS